jgi:antitoxin (DNA-binding transcriptional repressor) of toxin-antitoxin stability system
MGVTVLKAKGNLSSLLHRAETGEAVYIRRRRNEPRFCMVPEQDAPGRTLMADPLWKGKVAYDDASIWESEFHEEP